MKSVTTAESNHGSGENEEPWDIEEDLKTAPYQGDKHGTSKCFPIDEGVLARYYGGKRVYRSRKDNKSIYE